MTRHAGLLQVKRAITRRRHAPMSWYTAPNEGGPSHLTLFFSRGGHVTGRETTDIEDIAPTCNDTARRRCVIIINRRIKALSNERDEEDNRERVTCDYNASLIYVYMNK